MDISKKLGTPSYDVKRKRAWPKSQGQFRGTEAETHEI